MTKAFVRAKLPACDHYVITTFFYPPIRPKYEKDDHAGAAHPAQGDPRREEDGPRRRARARLPDVGERHEARRRAERDASDEVRRLRPAQERAPRQLHPQGVQRGRVSSTTWRARARSVANGGLSLIGEAVYLGKPIFSVPVRNQYEQVLNARYLEELGYGLGAEPHRGRPLAPLPRRDPQVRRRASPSTSRTATASSSTTSTARSSASPARPSERAARPSRAERRARSGRGVTARTQRRRRGARGREGVSLPSLCVPFFGVASLRFLSLLPAPPPLQERSPRRRGARSDAACLLDG